MSPSLSAIPGQSTQNGSKQCDSSLISTLYQTDSSVTVDMEYKGDRLLDKRRGTFRIGFVNINGIPEDPSDKKHDNILISRE